MTALTRRVRPARALLVAVLLSAVVVVLPGTAQAGTSRNLIKNGGADKGAGSSDGSVVAVPDWTLSQGTTFTAVQYGAPGGFPTVTDKGPKNRHANFFAGGPDDPQADQVATQTIDISRYASTIDLGVVEANLTGWLGGYSSQADYATLEADWYGTRGASLGSVGIGPVTAADRRNTTSLLKRTTTSPVPVGTRTVVVRLILTRVEGTYNDGYADSLVLKLLHI
jgi:hypothetical protein